MTVVAVAVATVVAIAVVGSIAAQTWTLSQPRNTFAKSFQCLHFCCNNMLSRSTLSQESISQCSMLPRQLFQSILGP